MYVGGGAVNGGVYGCSTAPMNGVPQWEPGTGAKNGSMFQANTSVGYLRRAFDYRSILGEIIRDHLGATQARSRTALSTVTKMKPLNISRTAAPWSPLPSSAGRIV